MDRAGSDELGYDVSAGRTEIKGRLLGPGILSQRQYTMRFRLSGRQLPLTMTPFNASSATNSYRKATTGKPTTPRLHLTTFPGE